MEYYTAMKTDQGYMQPEGRKEKQDPKEYLYHYSFYMRLKSSKIKAKLRRCLGKWQN